MKEVPLDSKQCNVMLVIKVNCCFPFIFMTDLKSTWKILILQDERVYKIFASGNLQKWVLSSWMYREWDLFRLTLDIHNEMCMSKWVTSTANGEKQTLPGKSSCVLFSSGKYSLCEGIQRMCLLCRQALKGSLWCGAYSDLAGWQNTIIERFKEKRLFSEGLTKLNQFAQGLIQSDSENLQGQRTNNPLAWFNP